MNRPNIALHEPTGHLKDFDGAAALRRKALEMIEAALSTELRPADRMQYLFVSAGEVQRICEAAEADFAAEQGRTDCGIGRVLD